MNCNKCTYWEPGEGYYCRTDKGYCNQPTGGANQPVKPCGGPSGHGEGAEPGRLKTGPMYGCIHFLAKVTQ